MKNPRYQATIQAMNSWRSTRLTFTTSQWVESIRTYLEEITGDRGPSGPTWAEDLLAAVRLYSFIWENGFIVDAESKGREKAYKLLRMPSDEEDFCKKFDKALEYAGKGGIQKVKETLKKDRSLWGISRSKLSVISETMTMPMMEKKTTKDEPQHSGLKSLGSGKTEYKFSEEEPPSDILETFPNRTPERNYTVEFVFPEFTSLCPKTHQPDFATIIIRYIPDVSCIESKSLKLYLFAFRGWGSFMESITNKIRDDLVEVCKPRHLEVISHFNPRGGIAINITSVFMADTTGDE